MTSRGLAGLRTACTPLLALRSSPRARPSGVERRSGLEGPGVRRVCGLGISNSKGPKTSEDFVRAVLRDSQPHTEEMNALSDQWKAEHGL